MSPIHPLDFELATTGDLRSRGFTRADVASAVMAGELRRIRRGWYATRRADARLVEAVRRGGAAGCITGAAIAGLWEPPDAALHLSLFRDAHPTTTSRRLLTSDVVAHWNGASRLTANRGRLPLIECLAQVIDCQPPDFAFAIVESALAAGTLTLADLKLLVPHLTKHGRTLIAAASRLSGSGSESLFKYRMSRFRLEIRQQVEVPGVGRVDFVIGDRLLVEIDSKSHHGDDAQRRRDLRRDAIAAGLGYFPQRFDLTQVLFDWSTVEATVLALIARGEHLDRRR